MIGKLPSLQDKKDFQVKKQGKRGQKGGMTCSHSIDPGKGPTSFFFHSSYSNEIVLATKGSTANKKQSVDILVKRRPKKVHFSQELGPLFNLLGHLDKIQRE